MNCGQAVADHCLGSDGKERGEHLASIGDSPGGALVTCTTGCRQGQKSQLPPSVDPRWADMARLRQ